MKIRNLVATGLLVVLCLFQTLDVWAVSPFKDHRYNGFTALPEYKEGDILFIGNSITHMINWNELFGNTGKVHNRGVSGAYTSEILENFDDLISDKLSKVFLMIGTNDLGTQGPENVPDSVAQRIMTIITKIREKAPNTEIYYESILPSTVGLRTQSKTEATNEKVKNWIDSMNSDMVKYVDLYSLLVDEEGNFKDTKEPPHESALSYDGLHLTQKGYKIWADHIKNLVGFEPVIPSDAVNLAAEVRGSNAMASTNFGVLPIEKDDIVLIGDEMIASGEWQELLGSTKIKSRGIGWGFPGMRIPSFISVIGPMFNGNREFGVVRESPKAVAIYLGVNDILYDDPVDIFLNYKHFVDNLKSTLPGTQLYIVTGLPFAASDTNYNKKLSELNGYLRVFSENDDQIFLIDAAKEFSDENGRREEFFIYEDNVYINGEGYKKLAELFKDHLPLNK